MNCHCQSFLLVFSIQFLTSEPHNLIFVITGL
jgi:hypothetical protein